MTNIVTQESSRLKDLERIIEDQVLSCYEDAAIDFRNVLDSGIALGSRGYYEQFFTYYDAVLEWMEEELALSTYGVEYSNLDEDQEEEIKESLLDGMGESTEDRVESVLIKFGCFFVKSSGYIDARLKDDDYEAYEIFNSPLVGVW